MLRAALHTLREGVSRPWSEADTVPIASWSALRVQWKTYDDYIAEASKLSERWDVNAKNQKVVL